MIRLGLTGGIASGKSTVLRQFAFLGARTYDADQAVHAIYDRPNPVREKVAARFPAAVEADGRIDRSRLGRMVLGETAAIAELEALMHPAVAAWEARLADRLTRSGVRLLVSDIPLLYEVGAEGRYDAVVAISCPLFLQTRRAMARPGMTAEKLDRILALQLPTAEKVRRADFVVSTGAGRAASTADVKDVLAHFSRRHSPNRFGDSMGIQLFASDVACGRAGSP